MPSAMICKEKVTPAARGSRFRRWESAEVLHRDHPEPADGKHNPFVNTAGGFR